MKTHVKDRGTSTTAASVAPEDVRRGDYVAVLCEMIEVPSFLWNDCLHGERGTLVRLSHLPTENRVPLKVKAICLPYVFVKSPNGQFQTLDVRLAKLVRLERRYAKKVWKALAPSTTCAALAAIFA